MGTIDARLSTGLPHHPKTKKLIRRLGADGAWSLVCLFLWSAQNRSSGNLFGMTDEDIEIAAGWEGDDGVFISALQEVKFLDGDASNRRIHNWSKHNPWAAGAEARSESAKWAALCKQHGSAAAAEIMPEYANRTKTAGDQGADEVRGAPEAHADRTRNANGAHADRVRDVENRSAPSPSPSPSPSPKSKPSLGKTESGTPLSTTPSGGCA